MSQLTLISNSNSVTVNVTAFSSPLYGQIAGTQTHAMAMWFPIKMAQPEIMFDVVFANETDYENFQAWVRSQQLLAANNTQLITLNWPARSITNWTGFIYKFEAGGRRWNVAPRARFSVLLVNSMVTSRTEVASMVMNGGLALVAGYGSPAGVFVPTAAENNFLQQTFGNVPSGGLANIGGLLSNVITGSG